MERRKILYIGTLHFFVDIYSAFFSIYLVIAGLDPIRAALISSVCSFIGNGLQPVLGYFADRIRGKTPVFLGMLLGAVCMSAIGVTTNYALLFVLVLLGRLGISFFHPAGSNISGAAGKDRRERGFSLFITIGTVGFSLSQPYFSSFTGFLGNRASPLLAVPAVVLALTYLAFSRMVVTGTERRLNLERAFRLVRNRIRPILLLFFIMVLKHGFIMTVGFFTAKAFADWGYSRLSYSFAGTFYNLAGAAGIFVSGAVAHRFKARSIMLFSLVGFLPFFAFFVFAGGAGLLWPAFGALAVTGFILQLAHVPNIIMGHRVLPEMTATISGILMGFAWSIGNLTRPVAAALAGVFPWAPGILSGLVILAVLPIASAVLTLFLPEEVAGKSGESRLIKGAEG